MRISEMDIIKYDIKDKKLYFISSVVSTAVFVIWIFLLWFGTGVLARIRIPYTLEFIIWVGFWPDCILTIVLWMKFLDVVFYLRRLKRAGYEIPKDKRVYYQNLKLLPRMENAGHVSPGNNYGSIILTVVAGMIVAGLTAYDIWFFVQYSFVGMDAMWLCEGILCSATFFWLIKIFIGVLINVRFRGM